jgi:hypothetical protein
MKSLLLGPAILMALVVAAAAEPYVCRGGTTVELSAQKGKVVSYTVLHADPRNTLTIAYRSRATDTEVPIVQLNGRRCEVAD